VFASTLWSQWAIDPASTLTAIMVLLWWQGGRGVGVAHGRRRTAAFWAGVLTLVIALNSPLDIESERLFWVHMVQHVLLLTVAPALLVISRPMPRVLRALPLHSRLRLVHEIRHGRLGAPLRWLARPWVAWGAFALSILLWHVPALYDDALRHQGIHDLEHLTYIGSGILFWNHALAVPPFATALSWPKRSAYIVAGMIVGWILAVTLAVAPHPLYAFYSHHLDHVAGISPLTDQQLAAGVMWVPGSITLTIALIIAVMRWLEPASAKSTVAPARPTAV
jgi:putative membrane protein